jgi:hypothetical protein
MKTPWQNRIVGYGEESPDQLLANPQNFRTHPRHQQDALAGVLSEIGVVQNVIVNERTGHVVDGHLRISLAMRDGIPTIPVTYVDLSPAEEATILATLDPISALATADAEKLRELLDEVSTSDAAVMQMLSDLAERNGTIDFTEPAESLPDAPPRASLSDRFLVPPFSVLDARQGYWQDRKREWLALGIQSELGRGDGITPSDSVEVTEPGLNHYRNKNKGGLLGFSNSVLARHAAGEGPYAKQGPARTNAQDLMRGEHAVGKNLTRVKGGRDPKTMDETSNMAAGTSVFDPVLCELAYRWFSPPSSTVFDPFAGGSVRGIVAAKLGRHYTGIDLSAPQIAANMRQALAIVPDAPPRWIVGDSADTASYADVPDTVDFVFSCPPYADLEVYSDDPSDLSNMDYPAFIEAYRIIIATSCDRLRPDRFACFVVGDVRDNKGIYRNFVSDTIDAFQRAGLSYYNEAILVTVVGSLPIRVGRQFEAGRKLGKTHQNVLVFVKGDAKKATQACGPVALDETLFADVAEVA